MIETNFSVEETEALILKALAHPFRLRMLEVLSADEECVCHLVSLFDKPQPYISQQLATLKEAGLVRYRRDAQLIYYGVKDPRLVEVLAGIRALAGASEPLPDRHTVVPGCTCPKCDPTGCPTCGTSGS